MFYGAPIRSLDDISRLRRTGFDFGEIAMANAWARRMWWESGLINGGLGKFFLMAHGPVEGRLQRQGPTGKVTSVIMEKALVGLCGPLTKLFGYVMKVRLPPKNKDFKPPAKNSFIREQTGSESLEQLCLGY